MNKTTIAIMVSLASTLFALSARAEEPTPQHVALHAEGKLPHYPLRRPKELDWSFAGFTGHYDKQQLQRGLKVYTEVCSACTP